MPKYQIKRYIAIVNEVLGKTKKEMPQNTDAMRLVNETAIFHYDR